MSHPETTHALRGELGLGSLLVVLFAIVTYLPSFDVPFAFDDLGNIVENSRVQPDTWTEVSQSLDARRGGQDRPVAMLTFALNHLADGLDPFGYHLVNLIIHIANGLLVLALGFWLARTRAPDNGSTPTRLALLAALVWTLHPVNTQAVTYIVQRMTSLAALFYLAGMLAFVLWRSDRLRGQIAWPLVAVCLLAGMGAKPIVVTLPVALLLVDWVFFGQFGRWHLWAAVTIAVVAVAGAVSFASTALLQPLADLPGRDFSPYERVLTQGRVLWHYLSLYALPLPDRLQLDYDFTISRGWLNPATTLAGWLALVVVTAVAVSRARRNPWPCFAWLFFVMASALEASFLNLELAFEHRVYLPAVFLAHGLLATVPVRLQQPSTSVVVLLLVGALALGTLERNRQWASFTGFWAAELERGASPMRATLNAAARLSRAGRYEGALEIIRRYDGPLDTDDGIRILQIKGEVLASMGRHAAAERVFRRVLEYAPGAMRPQYYLGQALLEQGRTDEATEVVQQMSAGQRGPFAVALEGLVARARGEPERGIALLQDYLDREKNQSATREALIRLHLAHLLRAADRPQEAMVQYRRVVAQDPRNWPAWSMIYQMLRAGDDDEQARKVQRYMEQHGANPEGW